MTKKQFLKTLRTKLQILNEQEINDIIEEYENHIDFKMKDGKSEKEAIEDFGDMDDLVKEILSAYKISDRYTKEQSKMDYYINLVVDKMIAFFKDLAHVLSTQKGENIIRIVFKCFIALLFIWLLKLPFYLIEGFGKMILYVLPNPFFEFLVVLWKALVWFSYLVVAVVLLYSFMRRLIDGERDYSLEEQDEKPKKGQKTVVAKKDTTKEETKVIDKPNYAKMMFQPFLILIRVFVIIVTLPLWVFIIGLAVLLGVMVSLLFQGIYLISAFFIVIGLLLIGSSLLGLIYYLAFRKEGDKE